MPTKDSSWMDEVAASKSKSRRPSNSDRPLLPFSIPSERAVENQQRSQSFSAVQTGPKRTQVSVRAAWNSIPEEAVSDDSDENNNSRNSMPSRRLSTPLVHIPFPQSPWNSPDPSAYGVPLYHGMAVAPSVNAGRNLSHSLSPTGVSRMTEFPRNTVNVAQPTIRERMHTVEPAAGHAPSYAQFPTYQKAKPISLIPPQTSGMKIEALEKAWDVTLGNRGELEYGSAKILYAVVEFKLSRSDVYHFDAILADVICTGSRVLVGADRGLDIGAVRLVTASHAEAQEFKREMNKLQYDLLLQASKTGRPPGWNTDSAFRTYNEFNANCNYAGTTSPGGITPLGVPATKAVIRIAKEHEELGLLAKADAEDRARKMCIAAVERHGLHLHDMEILAAEYQFDYNKLTFYFVSPQYLHFNQLVTELFKIFKTRIWMSALNPASCVQTSPAQIQRGPPGWYDSTSPTMRLRNDSQIYQPRVRGLGEYEFDNDKRSSMIPSMDMGY